MLTLWPLPTLALLVYRAMNHGELAQQLMQQLLPIMGLDVPSHQVTAVLMAQAMQGGILNAVTLPLRDQLKVFNLRAQLETQEMAQALGSHMEAEHKKAMEELPKLREEVEKLRKEREELLPLKREVETLSTDRQALMRSIAALEKKAGELIAATGGAGAGGAGARGAGAGGAAAGGTGAGEAAAGGTGAGEAGVGEAAAGGEAAADGAGADGEVVAREVVAG